MDAQPAFIRLAAQALSARRLQDRGHDRGTRLGKHERHASPDSEVGSGDDDHPAADVEVGLTHHAHLLPQGPRKAPIP